MRGKGALLGLVRVQHVPTSCCLLKRGATRSKRTLGVVDSQPEVELSSKRRQET